MPGFTWCWVNRPEPCACSAALPTGLHSQPPYFLLSIFLQFYLPLPSRGRSMRWLYLKGDYHSIHCSFNKYLLSTYCVPNRPSERRQGQKFKPPGRYTETTAGTWNRMKSPSRLFVAKDSTLARSDLGSAWVYDRAWRERRPLQPQSASSEMVLTSPWRCLDNVPARPPVPSHPLRQSLLATDGRGQWRSHGPPDASPEPGSNQ